MLDHHRLGASAGRGRRRAITVLALASLLVGPIAVPATAAPKRTAKLNQPASQTIGTARSVPGLRLALRLTRRLLTGVRQPSLTSITVESPNVSIHPGSQFQYQAFGTFSDGSTRVVTDEATWASSDTGVATISNAAATKGLATGVAVGTTTISATVGGVTGSTGLTVFTP